MAAACSNKLPERGAGVGAEADAGVGEGVPGVAGTAVVVAGGGAVSSGRPFIRYSTARSGLLKLMRIARCTSCLGKPISIMLLTAVSSSEPERNEPVCKVPEEGAGVDGGSDDDGAATLSGAVVAVDVAAGSDGLGAVSYTHLTLPTICSV